LIRFLIGLLAMLATALGMTWFFLADPRNLVALNPDGLLTSGKRFGLEIGMPMNQAAARMNALPGMRTLKVMQGGLCIGHAFQADRQVLVLGDDSWRRGSVCLIGRNGRLEKIGWQYGFWPSFD
jgi:hypothetical protein